MFLVIITVGIVLRTIEISEENQNLKHGSLIETDQQCGNVV